MNKSSKKRVRAWQRKLPVLCTALILLIISIIAILSTTLPIYAATSENGAISFLPIPTPTQDIPTTVPTKRPTRTPKPTKVPTIVVPTIPIETPTLPVETPTVEATPTPKPTPTPVPPTATPQGMLYPTVISTAKPESSPTIAPSPVSSPTAGAQPTPAEVTNNSGSEDEDGMMGIILPIGGVGVMVLAGAAAVIFGLKAQKKKKGHTAHRIPVTPAPVWSPAPMNPGPTMQSGWASQSHWEAQFGQLNPATAQQPAISDVNATQLYQGASTVAASGLQTYAAAPSGMQRNQGVARPVGQSFAAPLNGTMLTSNMLNEQATMAAPTNWPSSPNVGGMPQAYGNVPGNAQPMPPASGASFAPVNTPRPQINESGSPDASSIRLRSASVHADISSEIAELMEQEKVKKAQKQAAAALAPPPQPVQPLDDPFLEAIMRQAQQGIFALPSKEEQEPQK